MKILLDANLSWRLTQILNPFFEEVLHVDSVNLSKPAKDLEIWEFAKKQQLVIITNDIDFQNLSILKGFPPKVILLKTGNQSNKYLSEILIKHLETIKLFSENEAGLLEIV